MAVLFIAPKFIPTLGLLLYWLYWFVVVNVVVAGAAMPKFIPTPTLS